MRLILPLLGIASLCSLAACGNDPDPDPTSTEAQQFAERIGGGATPVGTQSPQVAPPLANIVPPTATDPVSATCGANRMVPWIGRVADASVRVEIEETVGPSTAIRFIRPGDPQIQPDASVPRLNLMLDGMDVIRDAVCG